jgi:pimeloyl-ACP methyl ester carboxylesterase
MDTKKCKWLIVIALILIIGGGLLAYLIQTSGGTIKIKDIRFKASNGKMVSALLYIPAGVSKEKPAPGIVATHGYINSRETQDGFAIEFARRGYVVLAVDQTGHGFSDPPAFAQGFGGMDSLAYLRTLDIVDLDNIGLEGHSMGGWASVVAAATNPKGYKAVVLASSSTGTFGIPEGTETFPRNTALIFSKYDEFSQLMWGAAIPADIVKTDKLKKLFGTTEDVEVG